MSDEVTRPDIVPDDWVLVLCQNECGDMVWIPPGVQDIQGAQGTSVIAVCTTKCALELAEKLP